VTGWIQDRANALLRDGNAGVKRMPWESALKAATTRQEDLVRPYVEDLANVIDWLRMAGPIFDQSIALEMLTFMDGDVREGAAAIREKRRVSPPPADSASSVASAPRAAGDRVWQVKSRGGDPWRGHAGSS
jgi:phosphoglucomutase